LCTCLTRRRGSLNIRLLSENSSLVRGVPNDIRSDSGPEFVALALRKWLLGLGTRPLYIEPGSQSEDGYCDGLNGRPRDES
jgi:putative transposase